MFPASVNSGPYIRVLSKDFLLRQELEFVGAGKSGRHIISGRGHVKFFERNFVHVGYNIHKLEMVQRKAARFISNDWKQTSSPTAMLRNLELKPLQLRRTENKVKFMHKIIHGNVISLSALAPRARNHLRLIPINARIQAYQHLSLIHISEPTRPY